MTTWQDKNVYIIIITIQVNRNCPVSTEKAHKQFTDSGRMYGWHNQYGSEDADDDDDSFSWASTSDCSTDITSHSHVQIG